VCSLKQYPDAANIYIRAEQFDKAAAILIHTKNFAAVGPLLDKITLPKLHAQYAKVRPLTASRAA
jgi:WD repeat-containing protein 19